ncbi:ammonia-forming cytochrome c nitrite reductase [Endozoicomonadaceae bacterium StTr2]
MNTKLRAFIKRGSPLLAGLLAVAMTAGAADPADKTFESRNDMFKEGFPRQHASWESTADMDFHSKHLGNTFEDVLEKDPRLVVLWAGYGFSKDYNAPRGHMYAITDVRNTLRTGAPKTDKDGPMPSACWSCKSPDVPRLINKIGKEDYFSGKWASKGSEIVNPIGCTNCHDAGEGKNMSLKPGNPWLKDGLASMGEDISKASHQDMKSLVCAQCHSEYYFAGPNKEVTFPWKNGLKVEDMEKYYDELEFKDWTHKISKTPMLKAQHPGWAMWKQGVHGKNNVSCSDCHMSKKKDKGVTFTDHRVVSPLRDIEGTCKTCHSQDKAYLLEATYTRQEQIDEIKLKAEDLLVKAHIEAKAAWDAGATEKEMTNALKLIRHAQWRWDFSIASHGASFHAPEEALRILGTAVEKAGEARLEIARVLAKHGINDAVAMPDLSSKAKAQAFIGLDMEKLVKEKEEFKKEILPKWDAEAKEKGLL